MLMNMKLKYCLALFLIILSGMMHAQNTSLLERLYSDFASANITLDFSYVIGTGGSDIVGDGKVDFQGNAYHMSGNGLDIYCDGKDMWLMDTRAKEVYIEAVSDGTDAFLQNPALLFMGLKDNFNVAGTKEVTDAGDGSKYMVFELVPEVSCGIDACTIKIRKDGTLHSGTFVMSEGQTIGVDIRSIKKSDRKDISSFRPTQSFDSSWMVTDLR